VLGGYDVVDPREGSDRVRALQLVDGLKNNYGERIEKCGISGNGICTALRRREMVRSVCWGKTWSENRVLSVRIIQCVRKVAVHLSELN
jgi:hypothetical protein